MSHPARGARRFSVRGSSGKSGATTVSLALARWFHEQRVSVCPLHFGDRGNWRSVGCPGAGSVSWPAALLAEACGLHAEPSFEGGVSALPVLSGRFDSIIIDSPPKGEIAAEDDIEIQRSGGRLRFHLAGEPVSLKETAPLEALEPEPEWLLALPAWESAAPRCGIVSLPHIADFSSWAAVRGAEWLTAAGIGEYAFLFLPMTSDRSFDRAWLEERGLAEWLRRQAAAGTRVVSVGWPWEGAERVEPETIRDLRRLSQLTGVRWPRSLPSEQEWDALTSWLERGVGRERLLRLLP